MNIGADNIDAAQNTDRASAALSARAKVVTESPARYAKQLVSHPEAPTPDTGGRKGFVRDQLLDTLQWSAVHGIGVAGACRRGHAMRISPAVRVLIGIVAALLGAAMIGPPSASADPGYLPSPKSGAVVTHLNLVARTGDINVKLVAGVGDEIVGVTVTIPAAGGYLARKRLADIPRTRLDLRRRYGRRPRLHLPDLIRSGPGRSDHRAYRDLPDRAAVSRPTGPVDGMTGTTDIVRAGVFGDPNHSEHADSFPVLNPATDAESAAEVRELDMYGTGLGSIATGVLNVQVQIARGEQVTGVYVALPLTPGYGWTVQDRTYPSGIECAEDADYPPTATAYVISCHDYATHNEVWPAGQYSLNLHVGSIGDDAGGLGIVRIRHLGSTPQWVDDFPAETPIVA